MKKKRIKSAIPIYGVAALWLLLGLIFPKALLKLWFLLLAAALSVGAYAVLSKLFPGREIEVREAVNSGSKDVDAMIENGRRQLDSISAAASELADAELADDLSRMRKAGEVIFAALEKDVSKAGEVRKFMNYYLPTAEKLVSTYKTLAQTVPKGENILNAMKSARSSMGMIADAFEKQSDNLYRDKALDIETDIEVLETMMSSDGLLGKGGIGASLDGFTEPTRKDGGIRLTLGNEQNDQTAQAGR